MQDFHAGLRWNGKVDTQTDGDAFKSKSKYNVLYQEDAGYIWAVKQRAQQLTF